MRKLQLIKYLGLILCSTVHTQRSVPLMQVESSQHITDEVLLLTHLHGFTSPDTILVFEEIGIPVQHVSQFVMESSLQLARFSKCSWNITVLNSSQPTITNYREAKRLNCVCWEDAPILCCTLSSQFQTFRLCNVIIFYGSMHFPPKKISLIGVLGIG